MEGSGTQTRFIGLDALFQYTGSGVQLFSGMVFYIIIVRMFNTQSVGAIALFVAIIGLFNVIFSFGLGTAAQHFTSYNLGKGDFPSVKRTIHRIILYGLILSLIGLISLQIFAPLISQIFLHSHSYTELVRILGIVLFGNIMFGVLNGSLLGIQNFRLSAIINIAIWVTYYFGAVLFAFYLRSIDTIVYGWAIGIFLGVSVELLVVLISIRKFLDGGTPPSNLNLFRYSLPVLMAGIISVGAASADRFVVSGLLNLSSLGIYNFSLLIATSISFLVAPFNNILMPKFSELFGRGEIGKIAPLTEVSSTMLSYFYVPSALGIAALAPNILYLLGGSQYMGGSMPLRIIMFSTAVFITQNILTQAVASVRRTRIFIYSSGFALASNVIFSIILIPKYALIGAAIGFSSVYGVTFVILYYFARRETVVKFNIHGISKVWFIGIVMFSIVAYMSYVFGQNLYLLPVYVLTGAFTFITLSRVVGVFKREDHELILSLFPSNFRVVRRALTILLLSKK